MKPKKKIIKKNTNKTFLDVNILYIRRSESYSATRSKKKCTKVVHGLDLMSCRNLDEINTKNVYTCALEQTNL